VRRSSSDSITGSSLLSPILPADRSPDPAKSPQVKIVTQNDSRGHHETHDRLTSGGLLTLDGDGGMTRWERHYVPGSV
jgi:hypothetical protein